jgi:hypothetical protein
MLICHVALRDSGRVTDNPEVIHAPSGLVPVNAHLVICFWIVVNLEWTSDELCLSIEFRNSLVPARNADPQKSMRADARQ